MHGLSRTDRDCTRHWLQSASLLVRTWILQLKDRQPAKKEMLPTFSITRFPAFVCLLSFNCTLLSFPFPLGTGLCASNCNCTASSSSLPLPHLACVDTICCLHFARSLLWRTTGPTPSCLLPLANYRCNAGGQQQQNWNRENNLQVWTFSREITCTLDDSRLSSGLPARFN